MPPPQCPECGRFLATAFVEQIQAEPGPCPGCGTELSLAEEGDAPGAATTPEEASPVPPPGATLPAEEAAGAEDAEDASPPPAAALPDDVEPEPETSVRPPDLAPEPDPLAGWDQTGAVTPYVQAPDPAVIAAGAGIGLLAGLVLGGRDHRGLGGLLGALLGALVARLRS